MPPPQPTTPARRPVAFITGAARRVGRAIALEFARRGCDIVTTYLRSADEAQSLVAEARTLGAAVHLHRLDLADPAAVDAFGAAQAASSIPTDILVHNASLYEPTPLATLTPADALRLYHVNALAPLLLSRHFAPKLSASTLPGGGAIVAMADIHAMGLPRPNLSAYSMSKAALVELVRTLARELAPRVRVNAAAPGVVAWPEHGKDADDAAQREYLKRVPLARAGTPDDAARTVAFLALDATYITGQILRLDGGRSLL